MVWQIPSGPLGRNLKSQLLLMLLVGGAIVVLDFVIYADFRIQFDRYDQESAAYMNLISRDDASGAFHENLAQRYNLLVKSHQRVIDARKAADAVSTALALIVIVLYFFLAKGDRAAVGLSLTPAPGWRYWIGGSIVLGLAVFLLAVPLGVLCLIFGRPLAPGFEEGGDFYDTVVFFPVVEEIIYRLAICVPLVAWQRPRLAIIVSGVVFALLHVVYGTANPANMIAGFLLAWAFLKSGTILVPMFLHAAGNLIAWSVIQLSLPRSAPLMEGIMNKLFFWLTAIMLAGLLVPGTTWSQTQAIQDRIGKKLLDAAKSKKSIWTFNIAETEKGILIRAAAAGNEMTIQCDHIDLQSQKGMLEAHGKVAISAEGLQARCDKLTITLNDDTVALDGNAEIGILRPGFQEKGADETPARLFELKGTQLSLRWPQARQAAAPVVSVPALPPAGLDVIPPARLLPSK